MAQRTAAKDVVGSSDRVSEEAAIGGAESAWGLDSTNRTQRKTLELASRIGKKPLEVLIDSGLMETIYQLKNVRLEVYI